MNLAETVQRSAHVLPRFPGEKPLLLTRGRGSHVWDDQQRRYFDAVSGAMVVNLGYGNERLLAALVGQLEQLSYAHNGRFTSEATEALAERLAQRVGGRYRAYFCSSGSETIEAALRICHVYHAALGRSRPGVVAGRRSYHGASLGALWATGIERVRRPFAELVGSAIYVDECGCPKAGAGDCRDACVARFAHALDTHPEAGVLLVESMSANALGAVLPPANFLGAVAKAVRDRGRLLVLDEIATSIGRTGRDFAFQHTDATEPDLICLSKGLGVGYVNLGAVLIHERVAEVVVDSGVPLLGHTYNGHPGACAVGLEVLAILDEDGLVQRAAVAGRPVRERLRRLCRLPWVKDVRGKGLMIAIELARGEEPFAPSERIAVRTHRALLEEGLITLPGSGSVDGIRGDHVFLAPPLVASDADLDAMVEILEGFFGEFDRRFPSALEETLTVGTTT